MQFNELPRDSEAKAEAAMSPHEFAVGLTKRLEQECAIPLPQNAGSFWCWTRQWINSSSLPNERRPRSSGDERNRRVKLELADGYSPAEVAAKVAVPVLMISGSEDRVNPIETNAAVLQKAMPNARLEIIQNAMLREFLRQ